VEDINTRDWKIMIMVDNGFDKLSLNLKKEDIDKALKLMGGKASKSDDLSQSKISDKKKVSLWFIFVLAFIVVAIFFIYTNYLGTNEDNSTVRHDYLGLNATGESVIKDAVIVENKLIEVNFRGYLDNREKYKGKSVDLQGRLRNEFVGASDIGIDRYFIIDDFGNSFELVLREVSQIGFFEKNMTTNELFNVSGKFVERGPETLKIMVRNITRI
jgi:hypothetical protein